MTSNQPIEQPQAHVDADARSEKKWTRPALWAMFATGFVLIPVTSIAEDAAADAGVPHWVLVAVSAAIAVASFVLLRHGNGSIRDGVLFGLMGVFLISAIDQAALASDVSETWIMMALLAPVLTVVAWRYYRDGGESPL